jgi:fibronectin-binding autotransporter adhesin
VAPRDGRLFSDAAFVVGERGEDAAQALLGRTLPDGGGDTFYNLDPDGDPARARGWMDVTGALIHAGGFRDSSGGIEGGADVDLGSGLRLGGALSYQSDQLKDDEGSGASQSLVRFSLYASQTIGPIGFSADLSWGDARERLDRDTGFGFAGSSRTVQDLDGAFEAAAPIRAGGTWIIPTAGLVVSDLAARAFAETDPAASAFALTGAASSGVAVSPFATIALAHSFERPDGLEVTPDLDVGYRFDALAGGLAQTLVAADVTAFPGNRAGLSRSSALVGASVTAHKGGLTGYASYRATVAARWSDQTLSLGLRLVF